MRRASLMATLVVLSLVVPTVLAAEDESDLEIPVGDGYYVHIASTGIYAESNGCDGLQTQGDAERTECPPADDQVI